MEFLIQIGFVGFFLLLGFTVGRAREAAHFRSIAQREELYRAIPLINLRHVHDPASVTQATLVSGQAVIATDYFKGFMARLRNIIGGEVVGYESLMERARREAALRVIEQARQWGATEVWNLRYETSNIRSGAHNRRVAVSVEVLAYGTAVIRKS